MSRDDYEIAELAPEAIAEIQKTEQKLSSINGHPITLIAYMSEETSDEDN